MVASQARPAYIYDTTLGDWVPMSGVVDTGQAYTFTANQTFNGLVNANNGINATSTLSLQTGGVNRMSIDSSGRVTKPNSPAFLAYHQAADINYGVGSTLAYPFTVYNIGNHYNTSNSTFTAPVSGRYLFSINANGNRNTGVGGVPRAYWKINGSNVANGIHLRGSDSSTNGLEQRSQTIVFNLSANDTVNVVVGENQWDIFAANHFMGYLVG